MREFNSLEECLDQYLETLNGASELNEIAKFCKVAPEQIVIWRLKLPERMARVFLAAFLFRAGYKIKDFDPSGVRSKIIFLLTYDLISLDDFIYKTQFNHSTELFTFLFYKADISNERLFKVEEFVESMNVDALLKQLEEEKLRAEKITALVKDLKSLTALLKKMQPQLKEFSDYNLIFREEVKEAIQKIQNEGDISISDFDYDFDILKKMIGIPDLVPNC